MVEKKMQTPTIINREAELRLAATRLDDLSNNVPVPDPVLFFYGVSRVGKTTLLQEIRRLAVDRRMPVVSIDFDREQHIDDQPVDDRYDGERGQVQLATDLMTRLERSADAPSGKPIKSDKDTPDTAANKLVEYVQWVQEFLKPVVLLFDTLEEAPPETFTWLQEVVLTRLLERGRLFVVIAAWLDYQQSQHQFIWPILRRTLVYHLRPFDPDQIDEQLRLLREDSPWLGKKNVAELTGGIPGLNEELISYSIGEEEKILRHIVEKVLLRGLEEVRVELLIVSTFRQFDTRLLRDAMRTIWPERYEKIDRYAARQLLKELRKTNRVEQHLDGYGYVVQHDIRIVLDNYQRVFQARQHFDTHCLAVHWFHQEVEKGDVVMLADELYHLAGVWRDATVASFTLPEDIPDGSDRIGQLQERLVTGMTYLKDNERAPELIEKIITTLGGDEFHWLLSENEIDDLIAKCKSFLVRYEDGDDKSL